MSVLNLLADIPPPPPEFPIINVTVPHPLAIAAAGLCVAAAIVSISAWMTKPTSTSRWNWPAFAAIGVLILTVMAAMWSASEYRKYQDQRGRWRGNRPVQPYPSPPDTPPQAAVPDPDPTSVDAEPDAPTSTDSQ